MIRLIHCVKRRDDVSIEDFRHFWNGNKFTQLIERLSSLTMTVEIKKNLTLDIPLNTDLQLERYSKQPFDAILEIIWQTGHEVEMLIENEEFNKLYEEMFALQKEYIDFNDSRRFFTEYSST